ncbi:MAG: hypothetical protein EOP82_01230 [Variovorax sp.]|nr:MAG: hypothetical protein EOP82_01230 [Variovorax sp.]
MSSAPHRARSTICAVASSLRRMLEFGRSMIVCRMQLDLPHDNVAYACFGYERTLAVLPSGTAI